MSKIRIINNTSRKILVIHRSDAAGNQFFDVNADLPAVTDNSELAAGLHHELDASQSVEFDSVDNSSGADVSDDAGTSSGGLETLDVGHIALPDSSNKDIEQ